jgi:hypothetical protein
MGTLSVHLPLLLTYCLLSLNSEPSSALHLWSYLLALRRMLVTEKEFSEGVNSVFLPSGFMGYNESKLRLQKKPNKRGKLHGTIHNYPWQFQFHVLRVAACFMFTSIVLLYANWRCAKS